MPPKKPIADAAPDPLALFHPLVRTWFTESLGEPSAPQRAGWPAIAGGEDTLILAPTGTGKTLAAFLWELNALIVDGQQAPLANAVHLLYVSPLKALNNDVQRNLEGPLEALKDRFWKAGEPFPEIRVGVRTGDTSPSARAKMLRRTPHILITTPESLHILLTSVRGRAMFSALRAVIVDEIHAVAGTKRGAHLALTLERLSRVAPDAPQRIGLSATQKPLDEVARYLSGCLPPAPNDDGPRFRPVAIVDCGLVKRMETSVVSPVEDLAHVDGTVWPAVATLALDRIRRARTTLVFVNNRAQAERIAAKINALAGEEMALPYHGSLSRERRFLLEERLKAGEIRALVTTSSLELGIDVGSVDLVLMLQSPKRVSSALQRVGRAGHTLDAVSRGVFVPTFRDDALEQMAILSAMRSGDVEPTRVVQNALDVLAQILVAIVASEESDWTASELYDFVRRAYPYHALSRAAFDETLSMLAGKYPSDVTAELDARVHWDRVSDTLTPAHGSRMVATISGGTIPDRGLYTVNLPDKTRLGELDEEFVHESRVGDAFALGSSTWRIRSIEHDRVVVVPAPGAPARMPFWHGEFMARSAHLTPRVGELRRQLDAARTLADLHAIQTEYSADENTVRTLAEYVQAQRAITQIVPDDRELVLEWFRDEVGGVRMVLHAPFGGRVNAPWGMALGRRMRERLGVEVQVQTTDDGLMLRLPDLSGAPPTDIVRSLGADEAEGLVLEEVGASSLFGARFRMNAARALLLPRGNPRRRMPLWLQRLKSADLLQAVRGYPSFPILVETYRDVLQDAFDMAGLADVLSRISSGSLGIRIVRTEIPSPFAQSLQFGFVIDWMYGDDTPRAEARAALLSLDRALLDELMGVEGADEQTLVVLEEVLARRRGTAPGRQARDADELAVLVDRAGDLTWEELNARVAPAAEWTRADPLVALLESGRLIGIPETAFGQDLQDGQDARARGRLGALALPVDGRSTATAAARFILVDSFARYVAAFGASAMATVYSGWELTPNEAAAVVPEALRTAVLTRKAARREVLSRYVALAGPVSVARVRERYDFSEAWVEKRLTELERSGTLLRGAFGQDRTVAHWCSRRLLEQARRRELAQARKAIEAVSIADYARFMQRWQHLAPSDRLSGAEGTAAVMEQLLGLARPGEAWEREYLPARIRDYDSASLGGLASGGRLVWAAERLPDRAGTTGAESRPVVTGVVTGVAIGRVRFFERGTGRLWVGPAADDSLLSMGALKVLDVLRKQGASFTTDLAIATSLGGTRVRDALRELVAFGLVTNDTVEALRDVLRWKTVFPTQRVDAPDPTRWLPADFSPSANRQIVQRRVNPRSLAKWRRPDLPGAGAGGVSAGGGWGGRWSLVHTAGVLGVDVLWGADDADDRPASETDMAGTFASLSANGAEMVARQWLARYGVVSRDWWKRERPAMSWREIYTELKRLEFRGEVRRGYFVAGLAGAQFALPEAVEMLREADSVTVHFTGADIAKTTSPADESGSRPDEAVASLSEPVVFSTSDPANVYALALAGEVQADPLGRPRGAGALLVTLGGRVIVTAEGRGARLRVRPDVSGDDVVRCVRAIALRLAARASGGRARDVIVETVDGVAASASDYAGALRDAGFRSTGGGMRYYAGV